jgi:hypothetical protein
MYIADVARNMCVCDFNVFNSVSHNGENKKIYIIFKVVFLIFKEIFEYFLEHICMILSA